MSHTITVAPITASEAGALDGHEVKCACGYRTTTSLSEREGRNLGAAHQRWAARNEQAGAEYGRLARSL